MRIPKSLDSLVDEGIIDEVVRPLMSGKEAQVYLVLSGGEQRVAKVYKDAQHRSFKHRAEYAEGRVVRSGRVQRAMQKHSRFGREREEAAWRSTEVEMIYRLREAGVRVPEPHHFLDGVLVMELIQDEEGNPAPRLGDAAIRPDDAQAIFDLLLGEVVKMLCAGVVHGDLSDFNVLLGKNGPIIIDLPQALNASANQGARVILQRDVDNLKRFLARFVTPPEPRFFAEEMWALYERGDLRPDTKLTGRHKASEKKTDVAAMLREIETVRQDAELRPDFRRPRATRVEPPAKPELVTVLPAARSVAPVAPLRPPRPQEDRARAAVSAQARRNPAPPPAKPVDSMAPEIPAARRRRRRRRRPHAAGRNPSQER